MRVQMLATITGTRDGEDWPVAGESVTLPDDEAQSLINAGLAVPAKARAESAAVAAPEDAALPKPTARKAPAKKAAKKS